ncbi:molybdenum cofactor cytidylyltransferase/nicotine blue oxidoreductase [Micromonospora phaseoli]|uniref:Molybdenum cofactor cytidylyltransferase/nicotine blue oxidoreductase n=1 Tax=Micromonospora phaseoli TaxID=1144548 RepID=A0A1H6V288_9ACTN|nr:molybdenum cofactor cytidylyltransferase/nicotine blue oxidoreductase [Micromonospora phaseoli]SEI97094.1 molybdenum cofactor cytidylyltransferase/nicotine blue oxidoreductase [Micromonospora phaseoli]
MTGVDAAVAGLVLAAGAGRRYGQPKALVEFDGRLLVERSVATARAGGCQPVLTVLGARAETVRARADLGAGLVLDNPEWATGMASSLRAGLVALRSTEVVAVVVLLVDMPGVTPEAVRRLTALAAPEALAMAGYGNARGHPVLLGRSHWAGVVASAAGDMGARAYLRERSADLRVVPCGDVATGGDIDTEAERDRFRPAGDLGGRGWP